MKFSKLAMTTLVAGAFALAPAFAPAANLSIIDDETGVTATADVVNWDFGYASTPIGPESVLVHGQFFTNSSGGSSGQGVVIILEADGSRSDWVAVAWFVTPFQSGNAATVDIEFQSDIDGVLRPPPPSFPVLATITETGSPQELAGIPGLLPANLTFQFTSDVEKVPAPSALALMLAGLLPLGWSYARRRG